MIAYGCAALLVFAGCASPIGGANSQSAVSLPTIDGSAASATNLAGQYSGKFFLANKPIGDAYFDLTQSGTAVGGTLKLVLSRTIREPVAMTLDTADNSFTGIATDPTGKTHCSYTLSGSYNPKTFVLRGTSSPLTCSGKVATFRTTESCFYNTGSATSVRRSDARGIIEC